MGDVPRDTHGPFDIHVVLDVYLCPRRFGGEVELPPAAVDARDFVGSVPFGLESKRQRGQRPVCELDTFDLRDRDLPRPLRTARLHRLPHAERRGGDEQHANRNQNLRSSPGRVGRARQLCLRGSEIGAHRRRIRIPRRGVFGERALDDRVDVRRCVRPRRPHGRRLVAEDRGDDADVRGAAEGPAAGEHLVEDGAE